MAWIKDVYLDLAILILVILFGIFTNQVLEVILWIYTVLLLISKALSFFMPNLKKRAERTSAPNIFYHSIYLVTIAIFLFVEHYLLAAAWLLVWIASAIQTYTSK